METVRRWILLAAVSAGLIMALFVSLKPFLTIEPVDMAAAQKDESRLTERGQYLASLPLDQYIAEITSSQHVDVAGPAWETLLADARRASLDTPLPPAWKDHISRSEYDQAYYPRQIHFAADDPVWAGLDLGLTRNGQQTYLVLKTAAGASYFSLTYHAFTDDDFSFGSGLSHSPTPPAAIFRPLRRFALWPVLAGLAVYILLPWPRRRKSALQYQRWRIILGDFASFLLFVPFFVLPMFVLGGAIQGLTRGWVLAAVMWPLAFAGVWLLFRNGRMAEYCLSWNEKGLTLRTGRRDRDISFAGIKFYQPLVLKPPKWLIIASWLGALAGRGSARLGSAGRALILGGSAYGGLGLGLGGGSSVFVWITDALGGDTTGGAGRLLKALDKAGVARRDEARSFTGITAPEGEDASGKRLRPKSDRILAVLLLTPFIFIILALVFLAGSGRSGRGAADPLPAAGAKKAEPVVFAAADGETSFAWSAVLDQGNITVARSAIPVSGGGFLVGGHCDAGGANVDAYLARLDGEGRLLWQGRFGGEPWDYLIALAEAPDGGFFAAGETRPETSFEGSARVYLVKTDASGKAVWEKTLGAEGVIHSVFGVRAAGGSECEVLGTAGGKLFVWTIDSAGAVVKTADIDPGEEKELTIGCAVWTAGGGVAATGEILTPGAGYKDLWLARFDGSGRRIWARAFGGKKEESGSCLAATADGGLIAAGLTQSSGAGGSDAFLVRVDSGGEPVWEKAFGTAAEESFVHVAAASDGGFLAVGTAKPTEGAGARAYVVRLNADGSLVRTLALGTGAEFQGVWGMPAADGDIVLADATAGAFFQTKAGLVKIRK
ncbi:MAG: hypothetical protein NTZ26_00275 [Candidatus Aminicenantes bacterium]|nr:hypothetical protein [Candidatus Aminicenantes bacterium]